MAKKKTEETPETNADAPEATADETPEAAPEAVADDAPATDVPADDAPATDVPTEDAPATDVPAEDAPATDVPAEDAPADDAPTAGAPADDAPATIVEEVETASEEAAGETTAEGAGALDRAAPSAPGTTRRDRLEQRRAARRAETAVRGPRTPEERRAEREERRRVNAEQRRRYRAKQKTKRAERRGGEPATEPAAAPEHGSGRPKVRQSVVVSDAADKTITVRIDVVRRHKRYHKILRSSVKLHAHDERNDANAGDTVRVVETRPMSRSKRWRLLDVVERAR